MTPDPASVQRYAKDNGDPLFATPIENHRSSYSECVVSARVRIRGSPKIVDANSNETPCLRRFAAAFASSHSNWKCRSSKPNLFYHAIPVAWVRLRHASSAAPKSDVKASSSPPLSPPPPTPLRPSAPSQPADAPAGPTQTLPLLDLRYRFFPPKKGFAAACFIHEATWCSSSSSTDASSTPRVDLPIPIGVTGGSGLISVPRMNISFT